MIRAQKTIDNRQELGTIKECLEEIAFPALSVEMLIWKSSVAAIGTSKSKFIVKSAWMSLDSHGILFISQSKWFFSYP